MIQINNHIDKDIAVTFLCEGQEIGTCTTALAFFDALCQIKQEQSDKYAISTIAKLPNGDMRNIVFKILPNGRISPATNNHITLWSDILCKQLLYLEGLNPNFFYDNNL